MYTGQGLKSGPSGPLTKAQDDERSHKHRGNTMYATINLPGSPLDEQKKEHQDRHGGVWVSTYFPATIHTNKAVLRWKYRDGSKVIK